LVYLVLALTHLRAHIHCVSFLLLKIRIPAMVVVVSMG
jgi:hypothetical protein